MTILGALRENATSIAHAHQVRDLIMESVAALFIAVGLVVGMVVLWMGILAVSIWCFLFMLNY
jgi:hypothetical protein